ncbi:MAG: 5-formyltetrahydrofolate cyclo-ligase [Candidatus Omnitrophica bacterium]|nr:5-formyltetrahydrofolate cyclo-ligase [Candidatus Omnitrophota bacterium]MBU1869022.1 5-formyltetrahydrofolate cyclo-ligase [Candidatus Omnitrophota bacterium]
MLALTKRKIRSKILLKLKLQKEDTRDRKSQSITKKLLRTKEFKRAKKVMLYMPLRGEVNTKEMISVARKLGKIVAVPVCLRHILTLRPCLLDENASLKNGPYGVHEPAFEKIIPLKDLDLVVVPGVAFDVKGNRLGRGKGYYDRFLSRLPKDTPSIGLAFDFQILPEIPAAEHDVSVKKVLFA